MATGLRVPFGVSIDGRVALESGSRELINVLKLALSSGEDDNPFQNLGINEEMIFDINDPSSRGLLRSYVRRILSKFSDRISLDTSQPIDLTQNEDNILSVSFRFVNLETSEVTDFNTIIT